MHGLGTIVNVAAIVVGSLFGLALRGGITQRFERTVTSAVGLSVCFIGISGALSAMLEIENGALGVRYIMLLVISLAVGALCGEAVNIEKRLENFGLWFRGKVPALSKDDLRFTDALVSASLLFCVGAMSIVGSVSDGLTGDCTVLFTKSVLDGVNSVIMASSMGIGVIFSAVPVALYQGLITLVASALQPVMTDSLISQLNAVGSVLITAIGINMVLDKKAVKVANLLPALAVPVLYQLITALFKYLTLVLG